ncbi:MAG TPA: hypothetical protein VMV74_05315 [Bacteroidales bacterium]|nr:hypothetical protein [Bacteroidales bacterium]
MDRLFIVLFVLPFLLSLTVAARPVNGSPSGTVPESMQDTVYSRQLLYNGRVWESRYQKILSHEFFMTRNPVSGTVTINGKTFDNTLLRYDIYTDELLILYGSDTFIQLNKEAVTSFTLDIDGTRYLFENFDNNNLNSPKGYGQVIYHGDIYLIKKHIKEIRKNAVENKYDSFNEGQSTWLVRGDVYYRLSGRKDLYRALNDRASEVKSFVRSRGLRFSIKEPESLILILEFYDSLKSKTRE